MFHTFEFICQLGPYKLWVKDPFHQITRRLATNSLWPEQQQYGFEQEWMGHMLITQDKEKAISVSPYLAFISNKKQFMARAAAQI